MPDFEHPSYRPFKRPISGGSELSDVGKPTFSFRSVFDSPAAHRNPAMADALSAMHEARKILFSELHDRKNLRREVVEAVDKLATAFELVENCERTIHLCPSCSGIYHEQEENRLKCYSCDEEWAI